MTEREPSTVDRPSGRRGGELAERVRAVPFWWHSIELGDGVVTPGAKDPEYLRNELEQLRLPDLEGKSVLDIGAWDGFYSFEAERRGAARVVALDHYMWSLDIGGWMRLRADLHARHATIPEPHTVSDLWRPEELPGKRGFDLAREVLGSRVEDAVADFMTVDLDALGRFDVVLYLGVLYHMESPLTALRRVARVAGELAVIETEGIALPGTDRPLCQFFYSDQLDADPTNWWAPNVQALEDMCLAAGFRRVECFVARGPADFERRRGPGRLRLVAHAWK